jgi:hypothetical protein
MYRRNTEFGEGGWVGKAEKELANVMGHFWINPSGILEQHHIQVMGE